MKKKENKKMHTPRQKSFITPSLHLCLSNTLHAHVFGCALFLMRKDVGIGTCVLVYASCSLSFS